MPILRKFEKKYYWIVKHRYNGVSFYYKSQRKARKLLELMEESLFYGDGADWIIDREPRAGE